MGPTSNQTPTAVQLSLSLSLSLFLAACRSPFRHGKGKTKVCKFLSNDLNFARESCPGGEGKLALLHNKKARDFTHALTQKSTLLSTIQAGPNGFYPRIV